MSRKPRNVKHRAPKASGDAQTAAVDEREQEIRRQLAAEYVARQEARTSLAAFGRYTGIFTPGVPRHVAYLCSRLEAMFAPDGPRVLLVAMPPGTMKTSTARALVAWRLAREAGTRCIWMSNRSELSLKQSRMILDVIGSPRWNAISGTRLSEKSHSAATFETQHSPEPGGMVALGTSSGARGYRANLIVLDDPAGSVADAASATVAENLVDVFERDLISRLLPDGRIVLFAQRLADRDLWGYLQRKYAGDPDMRLETVTLQMIADGETPCPLGRAPGELLWPEFFDESMCNLLAADSSRWVSEYLQKPISSTGGAGLSTERIAILDRPPEGMRYLAASDFALGESLGRGDYTVHLIAGMDEQRRLVIVDCWASNECDTGVAADALIALCSKWRPLHWLHEDSTIERSVIPMLKERAERRGVRNWLRPYSVPNAGADKIARAAALQAIVLDGRFALVRGEWNIPLLKQFVSFPGKHDDYIDAANLFSRVVDKFGTGTGPRPPEPPKHGINELAALPERHVGFTRDGVMMLNPGDFSIENIQPRRTDRLP